MPTGTRPGAAKVQAVKDFPTPTKLKDVNSFLGLANFFKKYMDHFSYIALPMYKLLKKDVKFDWSDACQKAFDKIKLKLTTAPLLVYPDFKKEFTLQTDASDYAIGGVLLQKDVLGNYRPVAYTGRQLSPAEAKYSTTDKECLSLVYSINHFQVYLGYNKFQVYSDHLPLRTMMTRKSSNAHVQRWALALQQYDFNINFIRGRLNVVSDALSRRNYPYDHTETDDKITDLPKMCTIDSPSNQNCSSNLTSDPKCKITEISDDLCTATKHFSYVHAIAQNYHFKAPLEYTFLNKSHRISKLKQQ
jgi:hypothetical protein